MKRIWLLVISCMALICMGSVCMAASVYTADVSIEFRAAKFYPSSKMVRNSYTHHLNSYDILLSKMIARDWDLYLSVGTMHTHGAFQNHKDKTWLNFHPFTLGVRRYFPVTTKIKFYAGLGATYARLRVKERDHHHERRSKKWTPGAVVTGGVQYKLTQQLFLDFFVDYQHDKFHFSRGHDRVKKHRFNMNGCRLGLGVGFTL